MAITPRAVGAWAVSNATTQVVTLPTHVAGDMLIVRTIRKPFTNPDDTVVNDAGWAAVATGVANGATANGNGVGSMGFKAFYKTAASNAETNPTVTWGTTSAPGAAVAVTYQKGAGESWVTPTGNGGGDATARTSQTSTIATHISVTVGDLVDFFRGQCDDSGALTVPTITQSGVTYDTVTEYPATALLDGTSNDIAADGGYRTATAGTSSAAAVVTGTSAASEQHGAWMTRLRVIAADEGPAEVATATGAALQPAAGVAPAGGMATATGAANNATVQTGKDAAAVVATAIGAAANATTLVVTNANISTSTGAALQPAASVAATTTAATATGAALYATVETFEQSGTNADAAVATSTGAANPATTTIATTGGLAAATGSALDATVLAQEPTNAAAGIASATGLAHNATATATGGSVTAAAGVASAVGQAHNASVSADDASSSISAGSPGPSRVRRDDNDPAILAAILADDEEVLELLATV
jgi:hypothetical protein